MDIHQEIDHLMAGIELELSQPTLEERLRSFLAMMLGDAWRTCQLQGNTLPNAQTVYSALCWEEAPGGNVGVLDHGWVWVPRKVLRSALVVRDEYGQFQLATMWLVEGSSEDL